MKTKAEIGIGTTAAAMASKNKTVGQLVNESELPPLAVSQTLGKESYWRTGAG